MIKFTAVCTEEEHGFLVDALVTAHEEAKEVLARHTQEDPPLFDLQTTGEAAEDYSNLVSLQRQRLNALEKFRYLIEGLRKCHE